MKYCINCGQKNLDNQNFCGNCGSKYKTEVKNKEGIEGNPFYKKIKKGSNIWSDVFLVICLIIVLGYIFNQVKGSPDNVVETDEEIQEVGHYGEEKLSEKENLYERAENLVYNHLTNLDGKESLSNPDIVGFEVYSFQERDTGLYYFETEKGEFQIEVKYEEYEDPSSELLFGSSTIQWAVYDWNTSELVLYSEGWNK